ncbi:MAG: protein deglycase HchA [Saprospiraceae bacterium]|nr:protein deglycase HchA [Saprospiraceae bacterium]
MLRKLLGLAPKAEMDGSFSPSKIALRLGTVDKTDFDNVQYKKYRGKHSKILVVFTEHKNMEMTNGKLFSTGNHPVEALLPMLHLRNAGFEFVIATATGLPVVFETWAFPEKDEHVLELYNELFDSFNNPINLGDFVRYTMAEDDSFSAVFIPGGHGAMIDLPQDYNVGKVLRWAHENELYTISICHGPGSFLTTMLDGHHFIYEGYKMCVFPDSVDKQTPMIGYLPGQMPWGLSERLKSLGVQLMNKKPDKSVCLDRKLITGASPLASNELGKLAARTLLKSL